MAAKKTKAKRTGGRFARLSSAVPGLIVTALLLALHVIHPAAMTQLSNLIFDVYQRAAPRPYIDTPVRIVDIDDATLEKLGQWPWPRTDIARLTQTLTDAGAAVVAYDIVFSEPDRTSPARIARILQGNPAARGDYADVAALTDHDVLLGQTFGKTPSVLGVFLTHEPNPNRPPVKAGFAYSGSPPYTAVRNYNGALTPLPVLSKDAAGAGFVTVGGDGDSIIRSVPLLSRVGNQMVPSLALEALRVAQGAGALQVKSSNGGNESGGGAPSVVAIKVGAFQAPTDATGALLMHYAAPRPDRLVPAWKVMAGAYSPDEMKWLFEGRIVFVGTGASGLRDLVSTPIADREPGVVVHAQAIEQIMHQQFLQRPDWWPGFERLLILVLGLAIAFSLPRARALIGGTIAVVGVVAVAAASWFAFQRQGMLLDPVYLMLGIAGPYSVGTVVSFYREERARAYIRNAFDRYLSPELVARIARDPSQLELGGEERDMTVMFCDIRSFSSISESLGPQEIIRFLIEFLTPMTDILLARKATVDKYIGDAILAFWNAPLTDPDHPRNAALAALDMVKRLDKLNAENRDDPAKVWPGVVRIGVGLNTGSCCVGNMGSAQRLSYSLIGDTVNLASRIEGLTKLYGVSIAIGSEMASRIGDFALIEIDLVRVVGREAPERLYALMGSPETALEQGFIDLSTAWKAVLTAYRAQDWKGADQALEGLAPHAAAFGLKKLAMLYADRIDAFRKAPPPKGWDGVFQATGK